MSTSSSAEYARAFSVPVAVLQYRDISTHTALDGKPPHKDLPEEGIESGTRAREAAISEAELAARIEHERANAARDTEQRLRKEYEQKMLAARAPIATTIAAFEEQRNDYFARVESEVIQLALAIAAKILHREA